jgi:hypothetical protein
VPVPINPILIAVPPSEHEIAAVDRDRAIGHPAGFVRREIKDRADDVFTTEGFVTSLCNPDDRSCDQASAWFS